MNATNRNRTKTKSAPERAETRPFPDIETNRPEPVRPDVAELFAEAEQQLKDTGVVDQYWMDDVVVAVVKAILESSSDQVSALERQLRTVDVGLRSLVTEPGIGQDVALAQLALLQRVSQVGAQSLAPREVARDIEPGSHAASILLLLASEEAEVFTDAIAERMKLHPTQLSRVFKRLAGHGLVERRKYGRRVSWALTDTGEAVSHQIRERLSDEAPAGSVTAASPEQFEDAVFHAADAIEIERPGGEDAWYLRTTFSRVSGDDVFDSDNLPFVLFPRLSEQAAYIRSDLARTLKYFQDTATHSLSIPFKGSKSDATDVTPSGHVSQDRLPHR